MTQQFPDVEQKSLHGTFPTDKEAPLAADVTLIHWRCPFHRSGAVLASLDLGVDGVSRRIVG